MRTPEKKKSSRPKEVEIGVEPKERREFASSSKRKRQRTKTASPKETEETDEEVFRTIVENLKKDVKVLSKIVGEQYNIKREVKELTSMLEWNIDRLTMGRIKAWLEERIFYHSRHCKH